MSWVGKLQRSLNELGCAPGPVDELLGPRTYGALFKYMSRPGADPDALGDGAADYFPRYDVTTPLRLAHWFAQFAHESAGFSRMEENLNYSAARLCAVWPKRFPTIADAIVCARNPERLAEKVYGGRMGNDRPGDGWKYRGRGPGLTGRTNYSITEERTGLPLVEHPELASDPRNFVLIACDFWKANGCNVLADRDDLAGITQRINGGFIGLNERRKLLAKVERLLS